MAKLGIGVLATRIYLNTGSIAAPLLDVAGLLQFYFSVIQLIQVM